MNPEQQPSYEQPPVAGPPAQGEQHEREPATRPRIWVASMTDDLSGVEHGAWIDAARDEDELQTDVDAMLAASPVMARTGQRALRWAITRAEGFGRVTIDEQDELHWVSLVAKGIVEHGLAFAAYADIVEEEELLADFDDNYLGHYDDLHAYVEQLVNDLGYDRILDENLPASIRPYVKIDISATANDLLLGGDLHALPAAEGGVWIFR